MEIIIQRILFLLDVKKMNSKELSLISGVSETQISRMLSGKTTPKITVLQKLAGALETTVSFLIGESDLPEKKFEEEFIQIIAEKYKTVVNDALEEERRKLYEKSSINIIKDARNCENAIKSGKTA